MSLIVCVRMRRVVYTNCDKVFKLKPFTSVQLSVRIDREIVEKSCDPGLFDGDFSHRI